MEKYTHTFMTASADDRELAKMTAAVYGMEYTEEYRPTCFKKYRIDITATTTEQTAALDYLIMSICKFPGSEKYETRLRVDIAARRAAQLTA